VSLDEAIEAAVVRAVQTALAPYLSRLADPEPLVYSVKEAAHVLGTSPTTVDRLIGRGVLPLVPHMGQRRLVPRAAVARLVEPSESPATAASPHVTPVGTTQRGQAASA
jgi:excisionase family DNA binding protein